MKGLSNFKNGQAFIGGFSGFSSNFVYAFYSFGGVELVAVAAGESSKPYKSVPRAIKATFFRIVLFYILTILTIGLCINYADPTLLNANGNSKYLRSFYSLNTFKRRRWIGDASASPVTVVFLRAGFGPATHVVNAVLLTAVLSATNSCFYASSRMLLAMARCGHAPRIFGVVNKRGVPVPALM
jgi:amino acid permease